MEEDNYISIKFELKHDIYNQNQELINAIVVMLRRINTIQESINEEYINIAMWNDYLDKIKLCCDALKYKN